MMSTTKEDENEGRKRLENFAVIAAAELAELTGRPPRTEMKCRICGGFSSAQVCWPCATSPVMTKYTLLEQKLREYLAEPSLDGRAIRQKQRKELLEMINT